MIILIFLVTGEVLWGIVQLIEADTSFKGENYLQNSQINHKYLIMWFYYHVFVHFVNFLWSTDLIFDVINIFE